MSEQRAPKVFATMIPSRKDHSSNIWVPTVNVAPAEQYGKVEVLLPAGSQFFAGLKIVQLIKQRLSELDYQQGDYFLPMGNPVVMAVAAAIAARRSNNCLKVLVWDKFTSSYLTYELSMLT